MKIVNDQRAERGLPDIPEPNLRRNLDSMNLDCFDGSEILHKLEEEYGCGFFAGLAQTAQTRVKKQGKDPSQGYEQALNPQEIIDYITRNKRT